MVMTHELMMGLLVDAYCKIWEDMPEGIIPWAKEHRPDLFTGIQEAQKLVGVALETLGHEDFITAVDALREAWAAVVEA